MNVIFDTNVVMDALTNRLPFADKSTEAIALAGGKGFTATITANSVTDLYFLLRKYFSVSGQAKAVLLRLVKAMVVLDTTGEMCMAAFESAIADFEDAVLVESAMKWGADYIVTRNVRDFAPSPVQALTPEEFIEHIG